MTIRVAVAGATGKLGTVAAQLIERSPEFELVAALNSTSPLEDMLGDEDHQTDVLIDVTLPAVSREIVEFAVAHGINVLVGTSGWSAERIAALERTLAGQPERGVVIIPNFSLGSALATAFAAVAGRFYDSVEIVETHGAGKVDSPSGTAVRTAELIAAARGERGPVEAPHNDQRARGQQIASIPVHSLRMQGAVANQRVILGGAGERLTIEHDTIDARAYEPGILLAVRAAASATGVTVGLDKLVDLGIGAE
jgi:4-hydroxy-tetrahydrodipicolinate reductase